MLTAQREILTPWCVAIIDDSPDDRADIRRMLLKGSQRRLSFIEAGTAAAGISAVLGAVRPPDCIVLDYNLPEMDAPEVMAALRGPDGMPMCPVVVVTGGENLEEGRRVLRAGGQDYIGKDWTSPQALSRAIENASESWLMARELRQRKEALRLVTDRETFRNVFSDATRALTDEHAIKRVASQLLGLYLAANRLTYAEVLDDGMVAVEPGYVSGVPQTEGIYRLQDYVPTLLATLHAGGNIAVADVRQAPDYSAAEKLAYASLEVVASLLIPILKSTRLVAILSVQQKTPRSWISEEILLAREIAERTWSAVEQARSEKKLQANELQLAQMLQIMPSFSAVLIGPTFVFQLANQAFLDVIDRGPEIIGQPVLQAMPELLDQPFPALLDEVYRTGQAFEAKSMVAMLKRGPDRSLVKIFVDFAYLPLRDARGQVSGIFVHGVDRTAEVAANQAMARREREIRSVTENTPDVLTRFDRQFRYLFGNSVIEKVTGLPLAKILGKTIREVGLAQDLCVQWERAISHVFDHGEHKSMEFSFPTLNGMRHFSCRLVPEFNDQGQVESTLAVTHDITDRRDYEQRLLEQDVRKDEFLATLAHELRNPLAPIRSGLQVLKLAPQAEVVARTLPVMDRQLVQLIRLIDDLLDVSRISSGKIVLKRAQISFQEVAAAAIEQARPAIDAACHLLTLDWPGEPVWLHADPDRLAQIFVNLLTNSSKYMSAGGNIRFSARVAGESILISVQDTGMGLPADMLGTVFNMFTQVNRTLDRAQGGLGIGLSLVKKLVEMHGGSVQAKSEGVDRGSEFIVSLPTVPVSTDAVTAPMPGSVNDRIAQHRILVVDDNVDAAETIVMLLDMSGHDVRSVVTGQEALDVALSFRPDVVVLDIGLPGMDGYEVARRLQANPATASAKLIALTGWGTDGDIQKTKAAGIHAHLTKPVDFDVLEALLAKLLSAYEGQ